MIIHATEDIPKLVKAVKSLLGEQPYILELLTGHHGNVIIRLYTYIKDCSNIFERICRELDDEGKRLINEFRRGDVVVIRLDKEDLVSGVLRYSTGDNVLRLSMHVDDCSSPSSGSPPS